MRDHASIPRFASSQQREVNKRVSCEEDHELLAATRELDLHGICRLWDQGPGETWGCHPAARGTSRRAGTGCSRGEMRVTPTALARKRGGGDGRPGWGDRASCRPGQRRPPRVGTQEP